MFDWLGSYFHLYGLLIGLGILAGLEVVVRARPDIGKRIEKMFWWLLLCGVVGARLYHVVDYWQEYYRYDWIKILFVWEGGLGIWGGVAGVMVGAVIYSRIKGWNALEILDSLAIGSPVAQAIGRLGNWANNELWGKNGEALFAYEAGLNLLLFMYLLKVNRNLHSGGQVLGRYLIGYGVIRLILENMRPDEIVWRVEGVPTASIVSVMAITAGTYFCIFRKRS